MYFYRLQSFILVFKSKLYRGVGLFIGIEFVKDKKTKTPASAECTELQKLLV